MKRSLAKLIIGATLIAVLLIIISQFASAMETSWPKYDSSKISFGKYSYKDRLNNKIDTRTSKEKYYYSYTDTPAGKDPSNFGNEIVFNAQKYQHSGRNETYTDNYYYKPVISSRTQAYNWRF